MSLPVIKDDPSIIDPAINKARRAYATLKTRPYEFRLAQLQNFKKGVQTMEKDICDAIQKDLGREAFVTWFAEVSVLISEIDHNIANLKNWMKDIFVDTPMTVGPATSKIVYEPLGCVLIIGSWNYPIFTTLGPLVNAIAAGNVALIKPSEISAFTSNVIKKLIVRHLDSNCYVPIEGQIEIAKALTSKKFDLICFTGSSEKGKLVAGSAAKNLTPCILELGGKSPTVVDESADLEYAAKKICLGRFLNAGQTCIAPDFALVHVSKISKFIELMKKEIKTMFDDGKNVGQMGKVINDFHHNRLCALLENHGGNVAIGNGNAHLDKNLTPTLILNPDRNSAVMKDEIFGPILPIYTFQTIDEVIKTINDGEKPLALYYFGNQSGTAYKRLERETTAGMYVSNEALFQAMNCDLPFGGVGYSGYGRHHGYEGFKNFSNGKSVLNKQIMKMYPYSQLYPPFTPDKQRLMKSLITYLNFSQATAAKRFFQLVIIILIARQVARGKINKVYINKVSQMLSTIIELLKIALYK